MAATTRTGTDSNTRTDSPLGACRARLRAAQNDASAGPVGPSAEPAICAAAMWWCWTVVAQEPPRGSGLRLSARVAPHRREHRTLVSEPDRLALDEAMSGVEGDVAGIRRLEVGGQTLGIATGEHVREHR